MLLPWRLDGMATDSGVLLHFDRPTEWMALEEVFRKKATLLPTTPSGRTSRCASGGNNHNTSHFSGISHVEVSVPCEAYIAALERDLAQMKQAFSSEELAGRIGVKQTMQTVCGDLSAVTPIRGVSRCHRAGVI